MSRPIIDFEVERRKISHADLYSKVITIPMYQRDAVQGMEVVKLTKANKKKEPMTFLQCLMLNNSITAEDKEAVGEFVTSLKKYELSADALAEIKSMLVCTISVSEKISRGITDAFTDFSSANGRYERDYNNLATTLYNETYDRLVELCGEPQILDAAVIMGGD